MTPEAFFITVVPIGHDDCPAIIRLRRGLKYLLRGCSLKCTGLSRTPPAPREAVAMPIDICAAWGESEGTPE